MNECNGPDTVELGMKDYQGSEMLPQPVIISPSPELPLYFIPVFLSNGYQIPLN